MSSKAKDILYKPRSDHSVLVAKDTAAQACEKYQKELGLYIPVQRTKCRLAGLGVLWPAIVVAADGSTCFAMDFNES